MTSPHDVRDQERIDETLRDSFPASDPPSWTLGQRPRLEEKPGAGAGAAARKTPERGAEGEEQAEAESG